MFAAEEIPTKTDNAMNPFQQCQEKPWDQDSRGCDKNPETLRGCVPDLSLMCLRITQRRPTLNYFLVYSTKYGSPLKSSGLNPSFYLLLLVALLGVKMMTTR
ncbi:hypothetical protein F7725_006088 [Dissostichus mawsoni]|uniref:Uncharacterized protein n=1 Tax=Dissostichus mawsoni TaxID=36200 RepID=A0A7J5YU77_DISMA|nr:hypothetical protein F7725_006088 [Dissostichus mawsoni]